MLKKVLVAVATTVVLCAVAVPAGASAAEFTVNGTPVSESTSILLGSGEAGGSISINLPSWGMTTQCDVSGTGEVGEGGTGTVSDLNFDVSSCVQTGGPPGCSLSNVGVANQMFNEPVGLTAGSGSLEVSSLLLYSTMTGAGCGAMDGVPVYVSGSVTGAWDAVAQAVTFTAAGPLSSAIGPQYVSGTVGVCVADQSTPNECSSDQQLDVE